MSKFAVIKTGGKQYLVAPQTKLRIEKILKPAKGGVNFDEILAVGEENKMEIGAPFLKNVKVTAEWLSEGKGEKVVVARYHSKTRYRKLKGHRQPFTEVLIKEIVAKDELLK